MQNYTQRTSKSGKYVNGCAIAKKKQINAKNEQLQFEEEVQKMKLQLKTEQQAKMESLNEGAGDSFSASGVQAKLPKLVITKFKGFPYGLAAILGTIFREH